MNCPRASAKELDFLLKNDPVFNKSGIDIGAFTWPYMGPGFPGLVRIVIGQQVSTSAAASMWQKFQVGVGDITPQAVMKLNEEQMRAFGLSRQKIAYITLLAQATARPAPSSSIPSTSWTTMPLRPRSPRSRVWGRGARRCT